MDYIITSLFLLLFCYLVFSSLRRMERSINRMDDEKLKEATAQYESEPTLQQKMDELFKNDMLQYQVLMGLMQAGMRSFVRKSNHQIWVILTEKGGYNTSRDVTIRLYPNEHIISYSSLIVNNLNDEDMPAVAELCHRLNQKLLFGRFMLDYEKGLVKIVLFYHLMGDEFKPHLQNNYLSRLLEYKIDYREVFLRVINDKELPFLAVLDT